MRFCQRCSSFQPVADFDGDRHTCRDALHAYNLARREMRKTNKNKRKEAAAAAGDADGVKRGAKGAKKTRTTEPAPSSNNANHAATAFGVDNRAIDELLNEAREREEFEAWLDSRMDDARAHMDAKWAAQDEPDLRLDALTEG